MTSLRDRALEAKERLDEINRPYKERQITDRVKRAERHFLDNFGDLPAPVELLAGTAPWVQIDEEMRLVYVGGFLNKRATFTGRLWEVQERCSGCGEFKFVDYVKTLAQLGDALAAEWECEECAKAA